MPNPITIRMGGYGPPTTGFSKSIKFIGDRLEQQFGDRVVPVENAQKLYDAVGSKNKTIKIFTTEEGGAEHAHVDNRQIGIDFAADWLGDNM